MLRALGRNDELAHSSIRFTIGRFTTEEEIEYTIKLLHDKIGKLRELSPLWEMYKDGVDLDAVASFHGGLQGIAPAQPGVNKAKVLVCNGAADQMVTQEQIDAFKKNLDEADVDYEFINYEGAMHSFTNPMADSFAVKFNMPLAYNAEADRQSWEKMKELFNSVFKSSGN